MAEIPPGGGVYAGTVVTAEQLQYLASGLSRGLSRNAILASMRGTDLAVRRQAGLEAMREIQAGRSGAPILQQTISSLLPSDAAFTVTNRRLPAERQVWGYVDLSAITGIENDRRSAVYSYDGAQTVAQIQSGMMNILTAGLQSASVNVAGSAILFTSALRSV